MKERLQDSPRPSPPEAGKRSVRPWRIGWTDNCRWEPACPDALVALQDPVPRIYCGR